MPTRMCAMVAVLLTAFAAAAAETKTPAKPAAPMGIAPPAPGAPGHWSVATGETVSPDRDALSFELGWPGLTVGYLHGLSDRADVGVKFGLLYGYEQTNASAFG